MVEPVRYRYKLILMTEKGKRYDISGLVKNLNWEEPADELAARITFYAKNDKTTKGRLSSMAKPGCYVYVMYTYKNGRDREAVRGRIVEWNPSAKASTEQLKIKAYDGLYDFQESSDDVYFSAGVGTKTAVTQTLAGWDVQIGKYAGPDVAHGKLVYKNEKLGSILLKILDEAKKKGAAESLIRSVKGKVHVLGYGDNENVYSFIEKEHLISTSHKISTTGMVTRVKVIGEEDDEGRRPVEATVDGKTQYGIRQKIVMRGSDESLEDAKKAAQEILDEDGEPEETRTIKTADIPTVRKGHMIYLKSSTGTGYFYVVGISHDCEDMTMQMDIKKVKAKNTSGKDDTGSSKTYQVGDVVDFHGGMHYVSSYPGSQGYSVAAGKAKITIAGGAGKAHPWHLVTENWSQTHVYGWVDDGSFD